MDQDQLNTHYKRLASTYNQSFTSSTDDGKKGYTFLGEEGAKIYQDLMKLGSSDKLVDLGAGTCVTAVQLARLGKLQHPVLCVEPVREMLDVAVSNQLEGIETLCETAEEFVKKDIKYDKIIMKGCVHHFPRNHLQDIFKGVYNQLNEGGILLIDKVSGSPKANISIYFERGHELHRQTHDGLTKYVMDLLKGLGMNVEYRTVEQQVTKTKAETIEYIKNRSVSSWEMLTDEEIADGVKEVEEKFGDVITVNGEKEIIIASK